MQCAADAALEVERHAVDVEAGLGPEQFHDQARRDAALEADPAQRVLVDHVADLAGHDVYDIGIVPDGLGGDFFGTDFHAVDAVAGFGIEGHERAVIPVVLREGIQVSRAAAPVGNDVGVERVGVDADAAAGVVDEDIVDDDGLGAAHEDRGPEARPGRIPQQSVAERRSGPPEVELEQAVGDANLRLLDFNRIEAVEAARDGGRAAGVLHDDVVEADLAVGIEEQAAPVAGRGTDLPAAAVGEERAGQVLQTGPGAVGAVRRVGKRREDDRTGCRTLGNDLRVAHLGLNAGAAEFEDDPGIDDERGARSGGPAGVQGVVGVGFVVAAGVAVDEQVLGQDVDDVGVRNAGGNPQGIDRLARGGADADEEPVDRVVGQVVAVHVGPEAIRRSGETVGVGRNGCAGAQGDGVEPDRRPGEELGSRVGVGDGDRGKRLQHGVFVDLAAAVGQIGLVDRIQKDAVPLPILRLHVRALLVDDAAPIAGQDTGEIQRIAAAADGVIEQRSEDHAVAGSAQNLQRAAAEIDIGSRVPHVDHRTVQLDHGPGVDHHGDPLRDDERRAVGFCAA